MKASFAAETAPRTITGPAQRERKYFAHVHHRGHPTGSADIAVRRCAMCSLLVAAFGTVRALFRSRASLVLEILALRQQLAILTRQQPRPRLTTFDRVFWVAFSRLGRRWQTVLAIVQPATVVRWHRAGFRLFWRRKSRRHPGRPPTEPSTRALIPRLVRDNPTWGAPRIHAELLKLGIDIAQSTVARYLRRRTTPPSSTWKTFLRIHLTEAAGMDFFAIPTATFGVLYGFVILGHGTRQILHRVLPAGVRDLS